MSTFIVAGRLALLGLLLAPTAALAQDPSVPPTLSFQLWALLAGSIVPLGGYALNYLAPWISEPIKAIVQVILAAVAGGLVELIDRGSVGFDLATLEYCATAVITALFVHGFLWRPAGISTALGGGRNRAVSGEGGYGAVDLLIVVLIVLILVFVLLRVAY